VIFAFRDQKQVNFFVPFEKVKMEEIERGILFLEESKADGIS
jgi:hypothetical protein